jgi:glyoxylase-like metal-dependent hydrolase (beta-lactamase superfamily II)
MSSFELNQLTPHIYWSKPTAETDRPVLGAVVGSQAVLMVDAGNSPAHAGGFIEGLRPRGLTSPAYIALTHYHWDHVFGAAYLDGLLCASAETSDRLREMVRLDWRDKSLDQRVEDGNEHESSRTHIKAEMSNLERAKLKLRVPDITFSQQMTINLGELTCQLMTVGGDHTSDSTIIYVPEEGVVFLGDCLYSGFMNDGMKYTREKLFPLLDTLLELDAAIYLPAHADQPIGRAELEKEARRLKTIGQAAAESRGIRSAARSRLEKELGSPLAAGVDEDLDAFLYGLKTTWGE